MADSPIAALLMGKLNKKSQEEEPEAEEDLGDGLEQIASEAIAAIKAGDSKEFAECLRDAFKVLESSPHDEYSES